MRKMAALLLSLLLLAYLLFNVISVISSHADIWSMNKEFLGGILILICLLLIIASSPTKKPKGIHGTAHHATLKEIRPFIHYRSSIMRRILRPSDSDYLILGKYKHCLISLTEKQQTQNILLTAPVGAGKTSSVIVPCILHESEKGSKSMFISDVKGELFRITAGAVARTHKIVLFSPSTLQGGYNPLAFVRNLEDAQELARCWIDNTGHSQEEFWNNVAQKILVATIMHLRRTEPLAPFSKIYDILQMPYQELKQLFLTSPSEAREIRLFLTIWTRIVN
jgi:Type IV secretory pathway, VirD4 components